MIKVSKFFTTKVANGDKTYHITIQEWKLLNYLRFKAYHKYDMVFPIKVPGWKKFEKILINKFGAEHIFFKDESGHRIRDKLLTWTLSQDLRCHHYSSQCRHIANIKIDKEVYDLI